MFRGFSAPWWPSGMRCLMSLLVTPSLICVAAHKMHSGVLEWAWDAWVLRLWAGTVSENACFHNNTYRSCTVQQCWCRPWWWLGHAQAPALSLGEWQTRFEVVGSSPVSENFIFYSVSTNIYHGVAQFRQHWAVWYPAVGSSVKRVILCLLYLKTRIT